MAVRAAAGCLLWARPGKSGSAADGASGDPSPFTALGCFVGAQAAVKYHLKRDSMEGLVVAVQGLGHVGYDYARRLHAAGAKLIVADIDTIQ